MNNAIVVGATVPAPGQLTRVQQSRIDQIDRTINDHLTERDIEGLKRDLSGNSVPKPGGGEYQHYKEVTEAADGLRRNIDSLNRSLNNPNLSPAARAQMEQAIQKAQSYVTRVEQIIRSH